MGGVGKYVAPTIPPYEQQCRLSNKFHLKAFGGRYYVEAKPCKDNPMWPVSKIKHDSRGGDPIK